MASKKDLEAGRAFVRLFLKNDMTKQLVRVLRSAQNKLRNFGRSAMAAGRQLAVVGVAMAAPFAFATRTFANFEDQMLTVKAVTGAVGDEFDKLNAKAKLLGRSTSFMAAEVAGGMVELGRAGFKPAEIDASIASVLSLARATGTELPKAAEIAAGTLRAFSLEADQMGRVSDVMVATANNSAQTLEELGDSMKFVAPIAEEYGLVLEDTTKALGVMANMQIKGSMAGTSMRMMLLQLSDPAIRKQLQGMGVDLDNFGDTMLGVGKAMEAMSGPERLNFAKQIFGQRAAGGALKLTRGGFDDLSNAIDNAAGSAAKAAAEMDSGLGGAFRILKSAIEGVQIAVGEALAPTLRKIAEFITKTAQSSIEWIKANQGLIVALAATAVGVTVLGVALMGVGAAAMLASFAVGGLATIVSVITSPLGALVAVVTAGAVAWVKFSESGQQAWGTLRAAILPIIETIKMALGGVKDALMSGDWELAGKIAMAGLKLAVLQGLGAIREAFPETFGAILRVVGKIGDGLVAVWSKVTDFLITQWINWGKVTLDIVMGVATGIRQIWQQMVEGMAKAMPEEFRVALAIRFGKAMPNQFRQADVFADAFKAIGGEPGTGKVSASLEAFLTKLESGTGIQDAAKELAALREEAAKERKKGAGPLAAPGAGGGGGGAGGVGRVIAAAVPTGVALTATYSAAAASISGFQPAGAGPQEKMAIGLAGIDENTKQMAFKFGEMLTQNGVIMGLVQRFLAGWTVK